VKPKKKIKAHSLTGRITDDLMLKAHKAVKKNRGTCGVDRISLDMYEKHLAHNLANLKEKLKSRNFHPKPLRRKWIPKGPEKNAPKRPLGIPNANSTTILMDLDPDGAVMTPLLE
jgi:retron-type reverse transcriptase